jgi:hypothetical protein
LAALWRRATAAAPKRDRRRSQVANGLLNACVAVAASRGALRDVDSLPDLVDAPEGAKKDE